MKPPKIIRRLLVSEAIKHHEINPKCIYGALSCELFPKIFNIKNSLPVVAEHVKVPKLLINSLGTFTEIWQF